MSGGGQASNTTPTPNFPVVANQPWGAIATGAGTPSTAQAVNPLMAAFQNMSGQVQGGQGQAQAQMIQNGLKLLQAGQQAQAAQQAPLQRQMRNTGASQSLTQMLGNAGAAGTSQGSGIGSMLTPQMLNQLLAQKSGLLGGGQQQ